MSTRPCIPGAMTAQSDRERAYEAEIVDLREMLTQAGLDAARLLAQPRIDASESEAAKQLQRLLLEELRRRVENTLATVIAINITELAKRWHTRARTLAVESRLFALGRAHDLLLQANWARAQLVDVIRAAIEPFDDRQSSRFSIQDIALDVDAVAVLPLTMSLNEFCTNAVKYGALSVPTGRIAIALSADEKTNRFKLSWTEAAAQLSKNPAAGFRHALDQQTGGSTSWQSPAQI